MKQTEQWPSSLRNRAWLGQFDSASLLSNLLDFSGMLSIYIVDKEQQVLYWGQGMETLTGLPQEKVIGKPCLKECVIDSVKYDARQAISLIRADGNQIELTKNVHILFDTLGEFAGGMGLFTKVSGALPNAFPSNDLAGVSKQNFHGILSRSPAMRDVFHIIQNAAETEATVLVRGESGSGKELVANAIHKLSSRQSQPFLAINCAALSGNLLESELFGHVRGAFTGAIKDHNGLFQRANGGTLFLDEVAEMPLELQAKLLRVLQERNYIPVGGNHSIDVDVRIVAATHRSLREEVKNGHFREDLMYRLRVVPIFLPPLRERREDISLLIWHFIGKHNDKRVRVIEKIDPDAMKVLLDYRWPGNVRELHNVVEYAFAVGRGPTLRLSELPPEFRESRLAESTKPVYRLTSRLNADDEKSAIKQALEQCRGRAGEAADLLGMSRATFWRKRKLYEL
jgi:transcriptional regulator with PAS, ATPase and Fis domain